MTKQMMTKKLLQKFSKRDLEESCWIKSGGRTENINELKIAELEMVFLMFFPKPKTSMDIIKEQQMDLYLKSLRSTILKDAQFIGLYDPHDWTDFNDFMLKLSPLKKQLSKYTADEFEPLIKQFKSMKGKYLRESYIPGTKAWHHKNKLPMPSIN